jgi:benzoylformate decarboxylase
MRAAVKNVLMDFLRAERVEYVFGIPGATEIRFMDALEKAGDIRYVLGLHEVVCVGMAEGYARVTGRPGVLNLHTATGLAAGSPLLYNAWQGRVPLVVTCGQNDNRLLQRDPQLTGDIVGIGRPHAKWSVEPVRPEDVLPAVRRAFTLAMQPPAGPVVVAIPQNLLEEEVDEPTATAIHTEPQRPPWADPSAMELAVKLLASAQSPAVIVESGVTRSGALDEAVRFAELIGAPVYEAWVADVDFPATHPQYLGDLDPSGPRAAQVFAGVDVLVGIGCSLFSEGFMAAGSVLPAGVKIVHIEEDPWEIGKNLPTACGLQGNVRATLAELNTALESVLDGPARERAARRAGKIREQKAAAAKAWQAEIDGDRDAAPISIGRLMSEIRDVFDDNSVIVDECWSASAALRATLPLERPLSYLRARRGGSIGEGLPVALGVKLGRPEKNVIAVVGDGSAGWSMQTLWSAARYGIPVTYVILNNSTYRQVKLVRRAVLGDGEPFTAAHPGMDIGDPAIDFSMLARSMGVESTRIAHPDSLRDALHEAIASGRPQLLDVMVANKP